MGVEADDIVGELQRLRQHALALRDTIAQAQASGPRSTEATDRSGAVRIVLGTDGLPESIRVDPDWRHRLQPAAFGAAVVEAFGVAAGDRMAAWSRALDRPPSDAAGETQRAVTVPPPVAAVVRPLGVLAEDMMRALDSVQEIAAAMPTAVTGTGSGGCGRLVVTLCPAGLVSCTAETRWASAQSGPALTAALDEALTAAHADLAESVSAAPATSPMADVDRLINEALAVLADPLRFVSP